LEAAVINLLDNVSCHQSTNLGNDWLNSAKQKTRLIENCDYFCKSKTF